MAASIFVAVDLETTGLKTGRDRITEVGLVRFTPEAVLDRYSTLVNPDREIPYRIERLTGIRNADVRTAPHFGSVRLGVEEFLGEAVVVGQNVGFDLAFLAAEGIEPPGPVYDTLEIATLLAPQQRNRSLAALAAQFGIEQPVSHRALADAETARRVFLALREQVRALPEALLRELIALDETCEWPPARLLREIAAERGVALAPAPRAAARSRPAPPVARQVEGEPRQAEEPPSRPPALLEGDETPLVERALEVLAAGRRHPEPFGTFEERPQQVGMVRAVAAALTGGRHSMVEAGTGTGKSLAYLIPAALWALHRGERVIVSTNTINLQEQLVAQDVPALRTLLRATLGEAVAAGLRVAPLKGRRNYLCRRRLAQERAGQGAAVDAQLLGKILVWLGETESGDRSELRLGPEEEARWSRFSAEGADCLSDRSCPYVRDGSCFLLRARKRAEGAHLVIGNHALLLSDLAAGGSALPASDTLIIDEAHHLEEAATQHLGASLGAGSFGELLDRLHRSGPQGRVAGLSAAVRAAAGGQRKSEAALRLLEPLGERVEAARAAVLTLFEQLRDFCDAHVEGPSGGQQRLRLTRASRAQPDWSEIEGEWEASLARLRAVEAVVAELEAALAESGLAEGESLAGECASFRAELAERSEQCGALLTQYDADRIVWLTALSRAATASLHVAPLQVEEVLAERLFGRKRSVVLTGATLCVEGRFDYLRERSGIALAREGEVDEEQFGSPFDYRKRVRLLLPEGMPGPSEAGYRRALEEALVELVLASEGRALALFTSHSALRATATAIRGPLEAADILVLAQGLDGSPARVVAALAENPRALVLGTASLWEGVDVPGPAVSLLVIARLPFAVPSDPVYAARAELYEEPFLQYAVPQAIVRFRQGFGRLIRRQDDRGVVAILDGRISSKGYGGAFLHSLPPLSVQRLGLHELGAATAEWLAR